MCPRLVTDLALARRLDQAEAMANVSFVEARASAMPHIGAEWTQVAGAYAMFDGAGSPCTQTFCLGLFHEPAPDDMDRIEAFFRERGASADHEVSPMAGIGVIQMLHERGYKPIELSQVMLLPLESRPAAPDTAVRVRIAAADELETWARTAAEGWRDAAAGFSESLLELMRMGASRESAPNFLAELDGLPVAAAAYFPYEGVALLAGASTVP
jgi:hypothetical protein